MEIDNIVSAAAYIFAKNEKGEWCILCGKRSGNDPRFQGGFYDVPVGMREYGEDPSDTARRETLEETGINLPKNMFRFIEKQPWGKRNIGSNFLCILDKCAQIGKGDWEHEGFMWLPVTKVDILKWAYGMGNIVKRYFANYLNNNNLQNLNEMDYDYDAENEMMMDRFMRDDPEAFSEMTGVPLDIIYSELEKEKNIPFDQEANDKFPELTETQLRSIVENTITEVLKLF